VVVNHPSQVLKALDRVRFPLVVKANVGGSGAGIARFDSREELEPAIEQLPLGPDGTALVQEYVESDGGAIVRVEVMDGQYLYAIRIVRQGDAGFNLCPADICQAPAASAPERPRAADDLSACPAEAPARPGLTVTAYDPPTEAIETAVRIARAASIDVGGIEYLVGRADGQIYFYDVNATSNFVANAPAVLGFDPTARFADFIVRTALSGATVPARCTRRS